MSLHAEWSHERALRAAEFGRSRAVLNGHRRLALPQGSQPSPALPGYSLSGLTHRRWTSSKLGCRARSSRSSASLTSRSCARQQERNMQHSIFTTQQNATFRTYNATNPFKPWDDDIRCPARLIHGTTYMLPRCAAQWGHAACKISSYTVEHPAWRVRPTTCHTPHATGSVRRTTYNMQDRATYHSRQRATDSTQHACTHARMRHGRHEVQNFGCASLHNLVCKCSEAADDVLLHAVRAYPECSQSPMGLERHQHPTWPAAACPQRHRVLASQG